MLAHSSRGTLLLGVGLGLAAAVSVAPGAGAQDPDLASLRTGAERSGFEEATSHEELLRYMRRVGELAPDARFQLFSESVQGRPLPLLLFSRPGVTTPAEAHASGKPVVLLGANAHGYNHVVREALLVMARELGTPGTALNGLLDEVVVLVVPTLNPDGFEAGTRPNARGADLNRDYMTLEEPETAAFVGRVLNHWNPHLVVDGHDGGDEQFGGAWPYHLLYQAPGLAGADPALTALADDRIFPWITDRLEAAGFEAFYWSRGDAESWVVGGQQPRMGRNYGGLSGKITLLFEVTTWTGFEGGMEVAGEALAATLGWAAREGSALRTTVNDSRQATARLAPGEEPAIPVAEELRTGRLTPNWRIPDPERAGEARTIEGGRFVHDPVGTAFRPRPWAWILPPGADAVAALLRRHGIEVDRLLEATELEVAATPVTGAEWVEGANLRRSALRLRVGEAETVLRTLLPGSWIVRSGQPLGRVAAHLLEVETTDSVAWWGYLTGLLPPELLQGAGASAGAPHPHELPILKRMTPAPGLVVAPWEGGR